VAFPRDETAYLQLALKLNADAPQPEPAIHATAVTDPVVR
jgi:hypothetical protein